MQLPTTRFLFSYPETVSYAALHAAAQYRGVKACLALLRGGAAVDWGHCNDITCLDVAASSGHAGRLLQVHATGEETDDRKRTCSVALHYAVFANKSDTLRDVVALAADVEYRKSDEIPNLHATAVKAADGAVEALLRAGADIEAVFGGSTPLHYACMFPAPSTVQLLLYSGADEKALDFDFYTSSGVVGIKRQLQPRCCRQRSSPATSLKKIVSDACCGWHRRIGTGATAAGSFSAARVGWPGLPRERSDFLPLCLSASPMASRVPRSA